MAHVHAELVFRNVECLETIFEGLRTKRVALWVENNMSQDLCSFLEFAAKTRWSRRREVAVVKTEDSEGRRIPGVTTNKKGCLVEHALRALERNVFLVHQFSTQSRLVHAKYSVLAEGEERAVADIIDRIDRGGGSPTAAAGASTSAEAAEAGRTRAFPDVSELLPTEDDRKSTLKTLVRQAEQYAYDPRTNSYSGKKRASIAPLAAAGAMHRERDDMTTALILGLGWLHSNMTVVEDAADLPVPVQRVWRGMAVGAAAASAAGTGVPSH